ncbi:MAG TPA: OB-fold domain-containing protein, partial [Acidimicrobiales bacterium]|nr:OB-fold domain-containing protein [Acidimicrobiales bacterium]
AFHPFFVDRVPYLIAAIELEEQEGLRLLSNLVRVAEPDVRFGMAVMVEFEARSPELTVPVFAPVAGAAR